MDEEINVLLLRIENFEYHPFILKLVSHMFIDNMYFVVIYCYMPVIRPLIIGFIAPVEHLSLCYHCKKVYVPSWPESMLIDKKF